MTIPTFSDLYIRHRFSTEGLAAQANVPLEAIDRMLLNQTVSQGLAERVLMALSTRTRQDYSLENVQVKLSQRETRAQCESCPGCGDPGCCGNADHHLRPGRSSDAGVV